MVLPVVKGKTFAHLLHDAKVDASQLILRHSAVERDVESRVIGPDPRPFCTTCSPIVSRSAL